MGSFVELKDVIKLYKTENSTITVTALRNIQLSVDKSDIIAIIGPSGSGKSTLIKLIGGIEKPSAGSIMVDTILVNELSERELINYRRYITGFIWQNPEKNLLFRLSVLKNIILPMQLAHIGTHEERKKKALELLSRVELSSRKNDEPSKLSGGEAQRIAIAVALANGPKLILADEPTGELDSANTLNIINYIKELNQSLGQTFIVVTHDLRFATLTSKTFKIRDGAFYGLHRAIKEEHGSVWDREHLSTIDSYGSVYLPLEIVAKANIKQYVKIVYNEDRGCVEILPSND